MSSSCEAKRTVRCPVTPPFVLPPHRLLFPPPTEPEPLRLLPARLSASPLACFNPRYVDPVCAASFMVRCWAQSDTREIRDSSTGPRPTLQMSPWLSVPAPARASCCQRWILEIPEAELPPNSPGVPHHSRLMSPGGRQHLRPDCVGGPRPQRRRHASRQARVGGLGASCMCFHCFVVGARAIRNVFKLHALPPPAALPSFACVGG